MVERGGVAESQPARHRRGVYRQMTYANVPNRLGAITLVTKW